MELSINQVYVLLKIAQKLIPTVEDLFTVVELTNLGLIYSSDPSSKPYQLTTKGKHRVNNHILKERNLPDYISKYAFPEAFDKFFSTSTPNAVNALCMSMLTANKLVGLNPITLNRLSSSINSELARQSKVDKIFKSK